MAFDLSPGLTRALARAAAWALSGGAEEVAPLHLFLGLVEEPDGRPVLLLAEAGLESERLTTTFLAQIPDSVEASLPFAAAIRDILLQAQHLARSQSTQATVASDHALFALLEAETKLRADLESLGLNFKCFQETIRPEAPPIRLEEPLELLETTDQADLARILDAAADRAREGLRVLEDYCRFLLGDAVLARTCKELRHELAQALDTLPEDLLLTSRDTLHDVGTEVSTESEQHRGSVMEVLRANARRLQEALRSLEEYGKVFHPELGAAIERIRYRGYTLEKALIIGSRARQRLDHSRLYVLLTESQCRFSLLGTAREVLEGGAQIVQLREKNLGDRALLALARELRRMTRDAGALLIVNDRPDIARLVEADGVHLGQDDMPVQEARRVVGPKALIGVSTHDMAQVRRAIFDGASYIGVGPTFASQTKNFDAFPGLNFVRQAADETSLPAFVLGGVNLDNLASVIAAGGRGWRSVTRFVPQMTRGMRRRPCVAFSTRRRLGEKKLPRGVNKFEVVRPDGVLPRARADVPPPACMPKSPPGLVFQLTSGWLNETVKGSN